MQNNNHLIRAQKRCGILILSVSALVLGSLSSPLASQTLGDYSATTPASSGVNSAANSLTQGPFGGSVAEGKATADVLPLSFTDALNRGLRNNLGLLLQGDITLAARGQRWEELSNLLPNLTGAVSENAFANQFAGRRTALSPDFRKSSVRTAISMPGSISSSRWLIFMLSTASAERLPMSAPSRTATRMRATWLCSR
jgi:hypothetical protein